jgi:hypothetical protein
MKIRGVAYLQYGNIEKNVSGVQFPLFHKRLGHEAAVQVGVFSMFVYNQNDNKF